MDSHYKYGVPIPLLIATPQATNMKSTSMDQIATMYMASIPYDPMIPNHTRPDLIPVPHVPSSPSTGVFIPEAPTQTKQLETLLDAIFDLKGQTQEIYKLKALAFGIKAELDDE
jgi:hypothetical protein